MQAALLRAGTKEIGGQIFGEMLAPSDFRATELTVQRRRGSFSRFVVDLMQAARDALRFFERTQRQFRKFNYIGEWHSHPSFAVRPSGQDIQAMRDIVSDRRFAGNFAVLMIVRLDLTRFQTGAWLFDPSGRVVQVQLDLEK
jgi:proteasome lid subunit RPN8/RPN11